MSIAVRPRSAVLIPGVLKAGKKSHCGSSSGHSTISEKQGKHRVDPRASYLNSGPRRIENRIWHGVYQSVGRKPRPWLRVFGRGRKLGLVGTEVLNE
jgi:hypothetical protein